MTGAWRDERLPSHRAEGGLRSRGPAYRRSHARALHGAGGHCSVLPRACVRPLILPTATVARQDMVRMVLLAALLAGELLVVIRAL
jgi:hypothetical protein